VTKATPAIQGAEAAHDVARDWAAVRASTDIQYAPVAPPKPPVTPAWLEAIGKFLRELFEPLGRALGLSWPVLQWILIGLAVILVLLIVWRLIAPLLVQRRPAAEPEAEWSPDRAQSLALLEDADRLAAEGQFDAATHLLLRRSVAQIAEARPDLVHPASTAREIAGLGALPERARAAFAHISVRVERSRFALRGLDAGDWQAARAAYAEFALERLPA
jgi:hypothetical protein